MAVGGMDAPDNYYYKLFCGRVTASRAGQALQSRVTIHFQYILIYASIFF